MLKGILLTALATGAAVQAYRWYNRKEHKAEQKETLQVWEGEGGNLPPAKGKHDSAPASARYKS